MIEEESGLNQIYGRVLSRKCRVGKSLESFIRTFDINVAFLI